MTSNQLSLAYKLQYLESRFPDTTLEVRKFGEADAIYQQGTFVRFEVSRFGEAPQRTSVRLMVGTKGFLTSRKTSFADLIRVAKLDKALRKTHSHQMQEVKQFLEQLEESDLFGEGRFEFEIAGFGDHASNIPRIDVRFPDVEQVIASIRFVRYSPIQLEGELEVIFGTEVYEFESVPKVLDFFGGYEIFRRTDRLVDVNKLQLRTSVDGTVAIVPYSELALWAPYLIVMQARNLRVEEAAITVTARTESEHDRIYVEGVDSALAVLFNTNQLHAYVTANVEPSAQWDYTFK